MSKIVDSLIALRIVYLLATPFENFDAFKLGLIDANGARIRKASTAEENRATNALYRLVWNLKRIIALAPGGKTRIGSLVAAYLLMKESEERQLSDEEFDTLVEDKFELLSEQYSTQFHPVSILFEDVAPTNVTAGAAVDYPTIKRKRKFSEFELPDEVYSKFKNGKAKFRRWSQYLDLNDDCQRKVYEYARKYPRGIIVLKDSKGNCKGIRYSRNGGGSWGKIRRPGKQLNESVSYSMETFDVG